MPLNQTSPNSRPAAERPAVDEWGIYDPSQAGLAALFERVEAKRRASADSDGEKVAASMREARQIAHAETQKPETD